MLLEPSIITASVDGQVDAGAIQVTFIFGAGYVGTVLGVAFTSTDANLVIQGTASQDDHLLAIPYTVSAGTVRIVVVRR